MPRYQCSFNGRTKGAIGIFYRISVLVEAKDPEAAKWRLYETHEHITDLRITEVSKDTRT